MQYYLHKESDKMMLAMPVYTSVNTDPEDKDMKKHGVFDIVTYAYQKLGIVCENENGYLIVQHENILHHFDLIGEL